VGKERLANPGFYVEFYGKADANLDHQQAFSIIYIPSDGPCKYIHWSWGADWTTLTWTCAPTKKKVAAALSASTTQEMERYLYFPDYASLCQFKYIHHKPSALTAP